MTSAKTRLSRHIAVGVVAGAIFAGAGGRGPVAHAAVVYGGPTVNSLTNSGYGDPQLLYDPGSTAGNGVAVGHATRYVSNESKGVRAVRWDASGNVATELGNLGTVGNALTNTFAYAVNAVGTAVGYAEKYQSGSYKGDRAVKWNASSAAAVELGNLGTSSAGVASTYAYAINAAGTTVGLADKYESGIYRGQRAARWDASGISAMELGNIGTSSSGVTMNRAFAVNAAGTAVGQADKYVAGVLKGNRAVRWEATGTAAMELGNLGTDSNGSTTGRAIAVNADGTAVGYAYKFESGVAKGERAVRWDASGSAATELDILGTDSTGLTFSQAYAVNAAGTAVGFCYKYEGTIWKGNRAVRWDAGGRSVTELGNLGSNSIGDIYTQAYAINSAGITVGISRKFEGEVELGLRAVAWGADGVAIELDSLLEAGSGWLSLDQARGISDTNWVTGYGTFDPDGAGEQPAYSRMFLLNISSVVPEPTWLSGPLICGASLVRRRRQVSDAYTT